MTSFMKYSLWAFASGMALAFMAAAGYEYRPGLNINAPLFTDHWIELR